jgi:hypothetical protein
MLCRSLLLGACVAAFFAADVDATTLVVYRTSDAVYLAADSRVARQREGRSAEIVDDGCKAIQSGRFAVAIAGVAVVSQTGFSVANVLAELPRTEGTLAMFSETLSARVSDALGQTLRSLKQIAPSAYRDAIAVGRTTVIVAGPQGDGTVSSAFLDFIFSEVAGAVRVMPSSHASTPEIGGIAVAGEGSALSQPTIATVVSSHPPADALRLLIDVQSRKTPSIVGGLVDIARVTSTGVEWVSQKTGCGSSKQVHPESTSQVTG